MTESIVILISIPYYASQVLYIDLGQSSRSTNSQDRLNEEHQLRALFQGKQGSSTMGFSMKCASWELYSYGRGVASKGIFALELIDAHWGPA